MLHIGGGLDGLQAPAWESLKARLEVLVVIDACAGLFREFEVPSGHPDGCSHLLRLLVHLDQLALDVFKEALRVTSKGRGGVVAQEGVLVPIQRPAHPLAAVGANRLALNLADEREQLLDVRHRGLPKPSSSLVLLEATGHDINLRVHIDWVQQLDPDVVPFWSPSILWGVETPACFARLTHHGLAARRPEAHLLPAQSRRS